MLFILYCIGSVFAVGYFGHWNEWLMLFTLVGNILILWAAFSSALKIGGGIQAGREWLAPILYFAIFWRPGFKLTQETLDKMENFDIDNPNHI